MSNSKMVFFLLGVSRGLGRCVTLPTAKTWKLNLVAGHHDHDAFQKYDPPSGPLFLAPSSQLPAPTRHSPHLPLPLALSPHSLDSLPRHLPQKTPREQQRPNERDLATAVSNSNFTLLIEPQGTPN